jgi:SAM-dependent methyltransferase
VVEPTARSAKLEVYCDPRTAAAYDARWSGSRGKRRDARKARALERALEILDDAVGQRVRTLLDVPCGTARFGALWPRLGRAALGTDLARAMLAEGRAKHPAMPCVAADLARLPFRDASFHAAVCVRFLHLVREPEQRAVFLRELRRVARLGVIVDWRHGRTLRVWGRHLRYRAGLRPRAPANPSLRQIRAEMTAAGFRLVAILPVRRAPLLSDKVLAVAVIA